LVKAGEVSPINKGQLPQYKLLC